MAGKYGPADVSVTLEDAPGGAAQTLSTFILNGINAKIAARMVQNDGLGEVWERHVPTGKKGADAITLEGTWDTTAATGTHAVLQNVDDGPQDDGRQLVVIFGDTKTWTVDVRLMSFEVVAANDNIQQFRAELQPTGAAIWT